MSSPSSLAMFLKIKEIIIDFYAKMSHRHLQQTNQADSTLISPIKNNDIIHMCLPVPFNSRDVVNLLEPDARTGLHSRKCDDTRVVSPEPSVFTSTTCIGSQIDNIVVASAILLASPCSYKILFLAS